MNPIRFYTRVDVTLSDKPLEVMYCIIGLISKYVAFKNLKDKENKNNVGSFIFWFDLGLMFVLGKWLPALVDGILLIILILPPIFKKVLLVMSLNLLLKRWNKTTRRLAQKYLFQQYVLIYLRY